MADRSVSVRSTVETHGSDSKLEMVVSIDDSVDYSITLDMGVSIPVTDVLAVDVLEHEITALRKAVDYLKTVNGILIGALSERVEKHKKHFPLG